MEHHQIVWSQSPRLNENAGCGGVTLPFVASYKPRRAGSGRSTSAPKEDRGAKHHEHRQHPAHNEQVVRRNWDTGEHFRISLMGSVGPPKANVYVHTAADVVSHPPLLRVLYFMMRDRLPGVVTSATSRYCAGTGPAAVPAPSSSMVVGDSTVAVMCEF